MFAFEMFKTAEAWTATESAFRAHFKYIEMMFFQIDNRYFYGFKFLSKTTSFRWNLK